eukprot:TRINITY_DN951_c0_g1_i4.p1 TRINITY_DN951_c0_g1~~TRINITY_DN951_c0_g1_i4.p1  ORF type:complete len:293 (-),score=36.84 TRINITY_DN951_c0_g1_i4:42-920(-)
MKGHFVYEGSFNSSLIIQWIYLQLSRINVRQGNLETISNNCGTVKCVLVLLDNSTSCNKQFISRSSSFCQHSLLPLLRRVARNFPTIQFYHLQSVALSERFNFSRFPSALMLDPNRAESYKLDFAITEERLTRFCQKALDGRLLAHYQSGPSDDYSNSHVQVFTANNFQEKVLDPEKDVLVLFHEPWCGECKNVRPMIEEIANKVLQITPDLVIGKFDIGTNDVPLGYDALIDTLPTLLLFPVNHKNTPIFFGAKRLVRPIFNFLKLHSRFMNECPLPNTTQSFWGKQRVFE